MPIAPTLILGLGGTGSKIVERVHEKVKESETGQSDRIAFVVFDTDINDLGRIRQESPEIFTVQTSTRNTVGEYLGINTNARDNWFPVNEMMNRKTLTEGAAQVRAISRLAFDTTLKGGNLTALHNAIEKLFRIDKDQEEQSLRVIITSSLAGGTGSGILLSVAMYLTNYLKAKFPKAKAITRGFFVQPDVFYKVIPGAEEQQNLQVNAYAAVRELDAFLMKGDNTLAPQYSGLKFEFPRVGAEGVEEVSGMPYDFCFLFDANNKDGGSLDSFASYLDHAATCIYTQSIGPMSKKSNSREDNVLREVIKNDGRNRYAGAGASRLVYPWQHVRDVTGLRWANEALSTQWLQFDHAFKEMQAAHSKQREAGMRVRDLDRGETFIKSIDSAATAKEPFARAVQEQCLTFDDERVSVTGNQWETYVENLKTFVEHEGVDSASEDSAMVIKGNIQGLDREVENVPYAALFEDLERHLMKIQRNAEESAGIMGYTLFKADHVAVTKQRDAHRLETYLRDRITNTFIHPVSARYFLYQTSRMLVLEKTRLESELETSRNYFRDFEEQHFDDPSTDEVETADMFASRKLSIKERLTKKPGKEKREMVEDFYKYLANTERFGQQIVYQTVLTDAMEYAAGLAESFERFFISLESNLKRLKTRIDQERTKYDDLNGSTTRYVMASSKCLDSSYDSMTYQGKVSTLDSQLSEDIYNRVRAYHMLTDEKDEGFFKDLYNQTMLGYFSREVMSNFGEQIKMDIIEALEREYKVLYRDYGEDAAQHYVSNEIEKAKKLAAPFIEQPLGEERHPIVACAYNPAIEGDADPKRKSLISELLGNYGGERDAEISAHEILFYNAIYGIRARDLSKFAPERVDETEHRAAGEYFTAYYNLVSGIKPTVGETKVITPHVDRRWHSISELPDLDDNNQAAQLRNIHRALILGLAYRRIDWAEAAAGTNNVYRFESSTSRDEDFVVSNGTPCDQFYEVVDALTINPVAVDDILSAIERRSAKAREHMRLESFEDSIFGKALKSGVRLEQLGRDFPEFGDAKFSIFDVAAFYALSAPSEEYVEDLQFAMVTDFLAVLRDEVYSMTDAEEAGAKVNSVVQSQFRIFAENLERYRQATGKSFTRKLRTVVRPIKAFAEMHDLFELADQTVQVDDLLRATN